jgi:hypothetical protein
MPVGREIDRSVEAWAGSDGSAGLNRPMETVAAG